MRKIKNLLKLFHIPYEILDDRALIVYNPADPVMDFTVITREKDGFCVNGKPKSFFQWYWGTYKK